jgi:DNA polymerase III epsilon subunit-like protein
MYLFFDTETTGLPADWKAPVEKVDNWPRMVQIAWIIFDNHGKELESRNHIIIPEGYHIPKESSLVHGITDEIAKECGQELLGVLNSFKKVTDDSDYLVAHNMSFDEKIVGAEMIRKHIENIIEQKRKICTMKETTDFCSIKGRYGYKWPTLAELHRKIFGCDFEDAHDASVDIKITAKCFWELRKREHI